MKDALIEALYCLAVVAGAALVYLVPQRLSDRLTRDACPIWGVRP